MAMKKEQPDLTRELKASIASKTLERCYVFCGEETFLLNYYFEQVKKVLLDPLTEAFNYHKFNNETFTLQAFTDAVENFPMMAEKTLVHVDEVDFFKLPEADRTHFSEVIVDIPEWCTVVFTFNAQSWKPDTRLKFWKTIESHLTVVEFRKQNQRELTSWITRHFAAQKKHISADLCAYLIDITGGTMTALSGEINKICAYSGADEIKKSDIDAVTEPVLDAAVFQMTDLIGAGRYTEAFAKLQTLLKMQQEPLALLGAIGSHFRRISTARTLLDNGKSASELAKLYGMSDYPARKTMDAARRFSSQFCAKASELVLETDRMIKTSYDAPERLLEVLLLRLAEEARNG